jgi:hypothetical protein
VGEGTTRSLDFGCADKGPTVLVIPSLIHRTISRYPARAQLSAASCEFQSPAARQRLASQRRPKAPFRLGRLHRRTARSRFRGSEADRGRPIGLSVIAWGLVALALRCQRQAACLALLATPWDFHAQLGRPSAWHSPPIGSLASADLPAACRSRRFKLCPLSSIPLRRNANSSGSQSSRARTRWAGGVHRHLVANPVGLAMRRRLAGLLAIPPLHSQHFFL